MNKTSLIGNRKNTRFQVLNCRVQLKSKGILGLFGKKIYQLSLIDLSSSGLQAISTEALKGKKEYEIAIVAPAFPKPIWSKGRVIWNRPYSADNQKQYYRIGLEFTYFKEQTVKNISFLERNPQLRETSGD